MTQAFNLSQLANLVNTSGQLNAAAGLYNQTPVANGGTGVATLASGAVVLGAGTSAVTTVPASTSGNILTANGTAWISQIASGGTPIVTIYTSPSPWTKSPTLKAVKVTLVGGGGGGCGGKGPAPAPFQISGGGGGGYGQGYFQAPAIAGPLTITIGTAGVGGPGTTSFGTRIPGTPGGSSSFGALITTTGGTGGSLGETAGGTTTTSPTNIGAKGGYATGNTFGVGGEGGLGWSVASATPNQVGQLYGGGGGCPGSTTGGPAPSTGVVGQNGATGFVIVEEFY